MTTTKKVPKKALTWQTDFELGDNGEDSKTAPFKMRARSGDPLDHWYWGRIVHDFEGMSHKGRVPIDYIHDDAEIIGYANKFDTDAGALDVSGALVPFKDSDRATEVIHKQKAGVPYEASIYFSDPVLEQVDDGQSVAVNGGEFVGPGVVVRQWKLRGIAVCPYGFDPNTETMFSDDNHEVEVTMSDQTKETPEVVETAPVSEEQTNVTPEAEAVESEAVDQVAEQPETDCVEADSSEPEPAGAFSEGERFLNEFGTQGAVWFAQGKSYDDARKLFTESVMKENDELKKKLAALEGGAGEDEPVAFSTAEKNEIGGKKPVSVIWAK